VDPEAAKTPALSPEDIGKVVADWEERQKRKKEKEKKDKEDKEKADKDKEVKDSKNTDGDKAKAKEKDKDAAADLKLPGSFSPKPASVPSHERFTLHRDMFAS
jgi:hypothetical protein